MQTEQELRAMGAVRSTTQNGKKVEYINLFAINNQIGNTKSTTESREFILAVGLVLLKSGKWSLTPNVSNAQVANNLLYDAQQEMAKAMDKKDAEIAALKAQLEKGSKKASKVAAAPAAPAAEVEGGSYV